MHYSLVYVHLNFGIFYTCEKYVNEFRGIQFPYYKRFLPVNANDINLRSKQSLIPKMVKGLHVVGL